MLSSAENLCKHLDPDQDPHNIGPDLEPLIVVLKEVFENVDFEKSQQTTNKIIKNYTVCKECFT